MGDGIKKSIKDSIEGKQVEAAKWLEKTKEDMEVKSWLKKAQHFEEINDFDHALSAYKKFLELQLKVIKSRPEYGVKDYYNLVGYYVKVGDCYKKTRHFKREEQKVDFQSGSKYYLKAAGMYLKLKEYKSANKYYELAASTYEEVEVFDLAADAYLDIADMYLKLEDPLLASVALSKAGALYEKHGSYEPATRAYLKSAELSSGFGDVNSASANYLRVGEIIRKQGRHEEAVKYYIKSAEFVERTEKYSDMASTYIGIAQNYAENRDYENAAYYYLMSSEISVANDDVRAASSLTNTARCYQKLGKLEDAIRQYLRAADINARHQKFPEAARNYWDIAVCYGQLGSSQEEADFYLRYAEYAKKGEDKNFSEGYEKASTIYLKLAEERMEKDEPKEAITFYESAALAFVQTESNMKAGDLYLKIGFLKKEVNAVDYLETFNRAAKYYSLAGDLYHTAECYIEVNDYIKAATAFTEYADKELAASNFYKAGDGYLNAGVCHQYNNQKSLLLDKMNKASKAYLKYIDRLSKLGMAEDDSASLGDAYMGLAEVYRMQEDLVNAKKYFDLASEYFEEKALPDKKVVSDAFLSKVGAKLSMQQGDYPFAVELLSSAIENFEEALAMKTCGARYSELLRQNLEESRRFLSEVGEKPEVDLQITRSMYSFTDTETVLKIDIINKGAKLLRKITFMPHLPDGIEVIDQPQVIDELGPGESLGLSVTLKAKKAGKYRIKPLEALYQDKSGDKYMKSSNFVSLEFVVKPEASYREYLGALDVYEEYAKSQTKNKNFYFAAEGYKSAAECFREFGLKRASDKGKMLSYYREAIDSYNRYLEELSGKPADFSTYRRAADVDFNMADCYGVAGELSDSLRYFEESLENYQKALESTRSEKEKGLIEAQVGVVKAFVAKTRARIASEKGDYESAKQSFEGSIELFEEVLGGNWGNEYFEFLRKNQKETRELYSAIKGKVSSEPATEEQAEMDFASTDELEALLAQKEEIEQKIENAKKRYYNRQLDESMLRAISEEFQKQLIDVDVKIESIKRNSKK